MRQSNIELCRIFSIIGVLLIHSLSPFVFDITSLPTNIGLSACFDDKSIQHLGYSFFESLGISGVNIFLLISGYFSIKPKKESILNLLYICFFYSLFIGIVSLFNNTFTWKIFLFLSNSSWFIPYYLGLIILSPALNSFLSQLTNKELIYFVILFTVFDIWTDWLPIMTTPKQNGYGILHFITMYIIGRSIKLTGFSLNNKIIIPATIILISLLALGSTTMMLFHPSVRLLSWYFGYNNPIIIIISIAVFYLFLNLNIGAINRINYIAQSVLAVLLLHANGVVSNYFAGCFSYINSHYKGLVLIIIWALILITLFILFVLVDQIRLKSYKYLKTKINYLR